MDKNRFLFEDSPAHGAAPLEGTHSKFRIVGSSDSISSLPYASKNTCWDPSFRVMTKTLPSAAWVGAGEQRKTYFFHLFGNVDDGSDIRMEAGLIIFWRPPHRGSCR